jgi:uncharacterized protein YabN with tetrapyrrole methylase and pyrophosphatase domain
MVDELGDVLFQVLFLSLLLEERGEGDLAAVAESCAAKLIRRHPHVYGDKDLATAGEVLSQWEEIKREVEGGGDEPSELPENLPALLYARKIQRRAANAGVDARAPAADDAFATIGRRLFELVAEARELDVDPELALRTYARRFMEGATE